MTVPPTEPEANDPTDLVDRKLGSFHLDILLARFDPYPPEHFDLKHIRALKAGATSKEKQAEIALSQFAPIHEIRHFHDTFGTRAGVTLFLARLALLQDFARIGLALRATGRNWPIPWTAAKDIDLPPRGWSLLHLTKRFRAVSGRFRGDLPTIFADPVALPTPLPYVALLTENRLKSVFAAFPAQGSHLAIEGERQRILYVPLAFDALLEGNAQALQRDFIESVWGPEVAQTAFTLLNVSAFEPDLPYAPTYNVTDMMVTRFLAGHGTGMFPRRAVLALSDRALTEGYVLIKETSENERNVEMCCAGVAFVKDLEKLGPETVQSGDIPPAPLNDYAALRDYLSMTPPAEPLNADLAPPLDDIEVLYRWIVREIILPLLEARLATSGRLLADPACYKERAPTLPRPPFRLGADGVIRSYAPPRVRDAWARVVMIDRLLVQLADGGPVILCPRAYALAPGLERVNYAYQGDCRDYIDADLCGRYLPAQGLDALPQCRFATALAQLGFAGA